MQVKPDWTSFWTFVEAEQQLATFKFRGPGFYLSETDTLLVVNPEAAERGWAQPYTKDTAFHFHCYNVDFSKTIFSHCSEAPVRNDDRVPSCVCPEPTYPQPGDSQ